MRTCDQPALGWTVVLWRQPVRFVEGQAEGGYADVFELICGDCGDHPGLNFSDLSSELKKVRGPCPLAAGIAVYEKHLTLNDEPIPGSPVPRMWVKAGETEMVASGTRWSERHTAGPPTEGARAWANPL